MRENLVRAINEKVVAAVIFDKSKQGRVISESSVLHWLGSPYHPAPPKKLRLRVRKILQRMWKMGVIIKRPELHSARSGLIEIGYDLQSSRSGFAEIDSLYR